MSLREPTSEQLIGFLNAAFLGADVSEQLQANENDFIGQFWNLLIKQTGMEPRDIQQSVHHIAKILAPVPVPNGSGGESLQWERSDSTSSGGIRSTKH